MKNELLRDVLAGCAGVLAVAAVIGLPKGADTGQARAQFTYQHAVLLPHYSKIGGPAVPQAPRVKITTGP